MAARLLACERFLLKTFWSEKVLVQTRWFQNVSGLFHSEPFRLWNSKWDVLLPSRQCLGLHEQSSLSAKYPLSLWGVWHIERILYMTCIIQVALNELWPEFFWLQSFCILLMKFCVTKCVQAERCRKKLATGLTGKRVSFGQAGEFQKMQREREQGLRLKKVRAEKKRKTFFSGSLQPSWTESYFRRIVLNNVIVFRKSKTLFLFPICCALFKKKHCYQWKDSGGGA